jgi:hypothetical protein
MPDQRLSPKVVSAPTGGSTAAMNYRNLLKAVAAANTRMVGRAAAVVNQALVLRNWLIGAYLVEYEQGGADRAKYGARLLERLAADLARRGIKGVDARTLRDCRMLFHVYPQIRGPLDPELQRLGQSVRPALAHTSLAPPIQTTEAQGSTKRIRGPLDPELTRSAHAALPIPLDGERVLQFSWSKLLQLIRIDDPYKRAFYENECLNGNWSKRQLARQIESLLYSALPRVAGSQDSRLPARGCRTDELLPELVQSQHDGQGRPTARGHHSLQRQGQDRGRVCHGWNGQCLIRLTLSRGAAHCRTVACSGGSGSGAFHRAAPKTAGEKVSPIHGHLRNL